MNDQLLDIFDKIIDCLAIIASNPNVYSKTLASELNELAELVDEQEIENEEKEKK